jgi:hypothetical protein
MPVAASEWVTFSSGGIALGSFAIALFFLRFWRQTDDRFFALFATAFVLFGVNRIVLVVERSHGSEGAGAYGIRLAAFVVILLAIVDKNRRD